MVKDENGNVRYDQIVGGGNFHIEYGGFSVYGIGWYILAPAGGGLAWELTNDAVFYKTYPLLYHKFENVVSFSVRQTYIHIVAQETSIIRKLFIF